MARMTNYYLKQMGDRLISDLEFADYKKTVVNKSNILMAVLRNDY